MALVIADRVKETSTTTGTGTLTLGGAATGYQTFGTAIGSGNTCYYAITLDSAWEVGIGTVGTGTLSRDTVLASSNSNALVSFGAGTKDVFATYPAGKAVYRDAAGDVVGLKIGTDVQAYDADLTTWAGKTAPTGTVVGTSDSQTLTNKTIALGSNTVSGTIAQFNTAVTDADFATLAGSETLTNKTLSGATISGTTTGGDGLLTRVMLQDTGWDFYDSGTTSALDYVNGSVQRWAPTGSVSLTVSNWPPSGAMGELLIEGINLVGATINWGTINWVKSDGTTTTTFADLGLTLTSVRDWVYLWTRDGGTTVYGKVLR